jgi:hypothetical protein
LAVRVMCESGGRSWDRPSHARPPEGGRYAETLRFAEADGAPDEVEELFWPNNW